MKKSDARATVEAAILDGLIRNADQRGTVAHDLEGVVQDVLHAIFEPDVRWALPAYLDELGHFRKEATP